VIEYQKNSYLCIRKIIKDILNTFSKNIINNGLFNTQNLDVKEYLLEREREREMSRRIKTV
jgi:hypothetical protein